LNKQDLDTFIDKLSQTAADKGFHIGTHFETKYVNLGLSHSAITDEVAEFLKDIKSKHGGLKVDLLLVITPHKPSEVYAPVKKYCDTVAGIASQCVTLENVKSKGRDGSFAGNLVMKINSKLGGVNVSLRELPGQLMQGTVQLPSKQLICRSSLALMCHILLLAPAVLAPVLQL